MKESSCRGSLRDAERREKLSVRVPRMAASTHPSPLLDAFAVARALVAKASGDTAERAAVLMVLDAIDRAAALLASRATGPTGATAPRDDLISVVCHDLKDPLSAIVMGTSYVLKNIPKGDQGAKLRKMGEAVLRATQRMNALVGDLHDLARIESDRLVLDLQTQRADALLATATTLAEVAAATKKVTLKVSMKEPVAALGIPCDRERVEKMLGHLLSNAIRGANESGVVEIAVLRDGDAVRFTVTDNGKGIAPERVPHVFDRRYNSTQRARDGAGLGLALVKGLARAHGGDAGISSELGTGTSAWFSIPLPGS